MERKSGLFMSIASTLFILLGILLSIHLFDEQLTDNFKKYELPGKQCKLLLEDPLAISALSRMTTQRCKLAMERRLCSMDDDDDEDDNAEQQPWPVPEVNNSCRQYFDRTRLYARMGCFKDSPSSPLLREYRYNFSTSNSPELCVQSCLRAGFPFAGVKFPDECFCGDSKTEERLANNLIEDSNCESYRCPGDDSQLCGGVEAIEVLRTGVQGKHALDLPTFHPKPAGKLPNITILFLFQLNGRNSRQIRRLLRMIYSRQHLYLVHVDSRQQFLQLEMLKVQRDLARRNLYNFRVFAPRMATIWGGTSLLELFLNAIASTLRDSAPEWRQWDFVLNLSETDMPLLSLEELEWMLASSPGKSSFLSSHGYNTASFLHKQGFHFHFMECEGRMWRVASRTNYPRNLRLDGGSDWLIVHRELAELAISGLELPSQLRLLFSSILLPLESFFHTLALNSDEFCGRVLYRNLRFTNWRRKQGCRCAALRSVVDWCGCSPLALRGDEARKRLQLESCQQKSQFFGRKFDSLVHNAPIAFVERQALRFRPELVPSDATLDATWINLFSMEVPEDSPLFAKLPLIDTILDSLLQVHPLLSQLECKFHHLLSIHLHKANSSTPILQSLFTCEVECRGMLARIELAFTPHLHEKRSENPLAKAGEDDDIFQFDDTRGLEWGIGWDVKEELFRTHPPVVDLKDSVTFLWHWNWLGPKDSKKNWTSPAVELELYGPDGGVLMREKIGPYDSVNGNQFGQVQLAKVEGGRPGTWKASLFLSEGEGDRKEEELARTTFPVFPAQIGQHGFGAVQAEQLFSEHFKLAALCAVDDGPFTGDVQRTMPSCSGQSWSSHFPDEKSTFPHQHHHF